MLPYCATGAQQLQVLPRRAVHSCRAMLSAALGDAPGLNRRADSTR